MTNPSQPDYLAQAREAFNSDRFPAYDKERAATAQALATMGILQQLTRIADILAEVRAEETANAAAVQADWKAVNERMRRQRENLEDSYPTKA
jgi:hypothetical protein